MDQLSWTVCRKLKGRKFSPHPYACDLAVGFWVGSEGCETIQFDFTVCGFKTTAAIIQSNVGLIICKSQKEFRGGR